MIGVDERAKRFRPWRYSVSTLVMATTLIAMALGWWIDHQQSVILRQELRIRDALIDAIVRRSEDDMRKAAQSLRDMNRGECAVPILLYAMRNADSSFSYRVALVLGHDVGPDVGAAVPTLIEWLHDDQETSREHSFLVLRIAALDSPDVQRAFLETLKHDNVDVRRSAVFNIGLLDWQLMDGARSALVEAMHDNDSKIREDVKFILKYENPMEDLDKMPSKEH
jgi:HEAT repeat protein